MYQYASSCVILSMRTYLMILGLLLTFRMFAQNDSVYQPLPIFHEMAQKSSSIVTAKVVEHGWCLRLEDGVLICKIRCLVTECFKGKLVQGDTITIEVEEYGNMGLGGKYTVEDTMRFNEGVQFIFFLTSDKPNPFGVTVWYNLVDEYFGAQVPTSALKCLLDGIED